MVFRATDTRVQATPLDGKTRRAVARDPLHKYFRVADPRTVSALVLGTPISVHQRDHGACLDARSAGAHMFTARCTIVRVRKPSLGIRERDGSSLCGVCTSEPEVACDPGSESQHRERADSGVGHPHGQPNATVIHPKQAPHHWSRSCTRSSTRTATKRARSTWRAKPTSSRRSAPTS